MHASTNIQARRVTLPQRLARRWTSLVAVALLCAAGVLSVQPTWGQDLTPETVLATVGDKPIKLQEVIQAVRSQYAGHEVPESALPKLSTQVLDLIVRKRLVDLHIRGTGIEAPAAEVKEQIDTLKSQIAEAGVTYEQFLTDRGLTEAALHEQLASDIMRLAYFKEQLTDDAIQTYFEEHRAEFDGSEKRLEHILIRPTGDIAGGQGAAVNKANQIRQQIVDRSVDFAEAATRHSDAPSRRDGGDLGYMKRSAPWDPEFMKVAFALAEDEISDALVTDHGVHLIRCRKIRRGYQTFANAREQVNAAAFADLQKTIIAEERTRTPVVFTGVISHVDLDTDEIIPATVKPSQKTP